MRSFLIFLLLFLIIFTGAALLLKPGEPNDGKIHLTWLTPFSPFRAEQVDSFNRTHSDIVLKADTSFLWKGANMQRVIFQCSSGLGPDLFDCDGIQLQNYMASGVAADITEDAKAKGFSLENTWPHVANEVSLDGHQYAYPANSGVSILIYNKNIFDRFNVPYPQGLMSWDECLAIAKKLTHYGKISANSTYGIFNLNWLEFFASLRGEFLSEDGTRVSINTDLVKKAVEMHLNLRIKDHVSPTGAEVQTMSAQGGEGTATTAFNLFAEGRFAMFVVGKWALFQFRDAYRVQEENLKAWENDPKRDLSKKPILLRLGSTVLPHFAQQPPSYHIGVRCVVVNSKGKNKEASLQFLKFLTGREYSSLLTKASDQLPPNPKYLEYKAEGEISDLSEKQMYDNTVQSMPNGYSFRKSRFILIGEVFRILYDQMQRLEADPHLKVQELLDEAQLAAEKEMQHTIDRDLILRKEYERLAGTTDVHQAHQNFNLKSR
jgi:ABC-type glycerol-3-phosphate transport system substrate-binding protein